MFYTWELGRYIYIYILYMFIFIRFDPVLFGELLPSPQGKGNSLFGASPHVLPRPGSLEVSNRVASWR